MAKARRSTVPRELATVLDVVRYAVTRFAAAKLAFGQGTHSALEEAIFLVYESLGLPVQQIDPFLPAHLTAGERRKVCALIEKRVRSRVPVAYLLNRAYLQEHAFYVDKRVIVPRSYLAELLYGELFQGEAPLIDRFAVNRVLDLCTGSGCLAVLACDVFPNAVIDAVDLSKDALAVAKINVAEHGLEDRITLVRGDLFAPLGDAVYDLIITNPPYVDAEAVAALPKEYAQEPVMAHAGGDDGLDIVRRILAEAGTHLTADGALLCEVGRGRPILDQDYPDTEFLWLDTAESSGEVFWLPADALPAAD